LSSRIKPVEPLDLFSPTGLRRIVGLLGAKSLIGGESKLLMHERLEVVAEK